MSSVRLGIDLGGTKIAGLAFGPGDAVLAEQRIAAPRGSYAETVHAIVALVGQLEQAVGPGAAGAASVGPAPIGVGMPGAISPRTSLVQNANSVWLNGRPLGRDLEAALGRRVRLANDANCFALSEAVDGAAAGAGIVFGVVLGTGCGGGLVVDGRLVDGPLGIGGEWGHNPLPWAQPSEHPGPLCWCGRRGCMETWVSGTALEADHARTAVGDAGSESGFGLTGEEIAQRAAAGDTTAQATLERHASRLARGLAQVVNLFDPDVIVLGGGLSGLAHLYAVLPGLMTPHIFADSPVAKVLPPRWGDASGVRGAARLWGEQGSNGERGGGS